MLWNILGYVKNQCQLLTCHELLNSLAISWPCFLLLVLLGVGVFLGSGKKGFNLSMSIKEIGLVNS